MFDVAFSRLRIPMAFFILSVVAAIIAGDVVRAAKSRITLTLVAMVAWLAVTTVLSTWRGGSMQFFTDSLSAFAFAAIIIALGRTVKQATQLMHTLAYSTVVAALLGFVFGVKENGRLALYQGTYGDPNQYAMGLLMGIPFLLLLAKNSGMAKKILTFAAIGIVCFAFLRRGPEVALSDL